MLRARWRSAEARVCAATLLGRFRASGSDTLRQASVSRPFLTVGAGGLVVIGLGSMIDLSARFEAGAALVRDWCVFGSDTFYRSSHVTVDVGLGIGVRLP